MKKACCLWVMLLVATLGFWGCSDDDSNPATTEKVVIQSATVNVPISNDDQELVTSVLGEQVFEFPADAAQVFDLEGVEEPISMTLGTFDVDLDTEETFTDVAFASGTRQSTGEAVLGSLCMTITNEGVEPGNELYPTGAFICIDFDVVGSVEVSGDSGQKQNVQKITTKLTNVKKIQLDENNQPVVDPDTGEYVTEEASASGESQSSSEEDLLSQLNNALDINVEVNASGQLQSVSVSVNGQQSQDASIDEESIQSIIEVVQNTGSTGGSN